LERLNPQARAHPAVSYAVKAFHDPQASVSVADVVEHTGLSARRFIAVFRDQVGLAPKQFDRMCRFRRAIRSIDSRTEVDWADTAVACGYFDQAHFIHDFRAFAGMTPSFYIRHRTASLNHIRAAD
jgi:transcriptional regulator GlxA family with amidase domain